MPLVTSGVVGVFTSPKTRSPSIRTASVLVPPTSMPIRVDILSACSALRIPRPHEIGPDQAGPNGGSISRPTATCHRLIALISGLFYAHRHTQRDDAAKSGT